MLDLDKIALERAHNLAQERQAWLDAVWSEGFQSLSARLTDGEVIELLASCASAAELRAVTHKLGAVPRDSSVTPYDWLKNEAQTAGVTPAEWIKRAAGVHS